MKNFMRRACLSLAVMVVLSIFVACHGPNAMPSMPVTTPPKQHTIEDRLAQYGEAARQRLRPHLDAAGITGWPEGCRVTMLALKQERRLELYVAAPGTDDAFKHVRDYAILGASGGPGPKLRRGDHQVPEGLYRIELLNPNSRFHLSLRVNYPNEFDSARAAVEGRTDPGGDIMIHGGSSSVGCIAVGDQAAEDLFVLAADVGIEAIDLVIAPCDLRVSDPPELGDDAPAWMDDVYADVKAAMMPLNP